MSVNLRSGERTNSTQEMCVSLRIQSKGVLASWCVGVLVWVWCGEGDQSGMCGGVLVVYVRELCGEMRFGEELSRLSSSDSRRPGSSHTRPETCQGLFQSSHSRCGLAFSSIVLKMCAPSPSQRSKCVTYCTPDSSSSFWHLQPVYHRLPSADAPFPPRQLNLFFQNLLPISSQSSWPAWCKTLTSGSDSICC